MYSKGRHSTKSTKGVDRRRNEYKQLLRESVTPEDFKNLIEVVKTKALNGDIKAIQLMFDYTLGRPTQNIDLDTHQDEEINKIEVHIIRSNDETND